MEYPLNAVFVKIRMFLVMKIDGKNALFWIGLSEGIKERGK